MANKKKGGGGGQKPKTEISLTESHERSWNKWRVTITATVRENQKPVENKAIAFMMGNRQIGGLVATDADGKANQTFVLPSGTHIVIAKLPDGTQRDITIALDASRQKTAKIRSHNSMEGNGQYNVTFQVLTTNNEPIAGATLRVHAPGVWFDLPPTDDNGVVEMGVWVNPQRRDVVCDVTLLGTNVSIWKNFFRSQEIQPI